MNKLMAGSIAIVMFLLAGCTPQPAGFTVDDLYGIWTHGGDYNQFNEDGTYVVAASVDELTSRPIEYGDFRFEGTTLTFITNEESGICAGKTGNYEVEMAEASRIEITLVEDSCGARSRFLRNVFLKRYSP